MKDVDLRCEAGDGNFEMSAIPFFDSCFLLPNSDS
jgi:hypothetical protein